MEYIKDVDYEYISNKYHDASKPFNSFARFIRRDEIFSVETGMDGDKIKENILLEDKKIMEDIFGEINGILYEKDDERQLVSAGYIQALNYVSMTESNMINAAEHLLKETQSDMSLSGLVNTITKTKNFASENLICDFEQSNLLHALALKGKSILSIDVNKDEKKIDISMENYSGSVVKTKI